MATSLSRTGTASPLGKLTFEMKLRLHEPVHDALEAQARDLGLPFGEYVREVLTVKALGYDRMRKLYESRLEGVCGTGDEAGRNGG